MSNAVSLLAEPAQTHEAFLHYGAPGAHGPLVIAVPHAGRHYSADLLARARVPGTVLARLEDRLADHLVHPLANQGYCVLVARQPRALIDLKDWRRLAICGVAPSPMRSYAPASKIYTGPITPCSPPCWTQRGGGTESPCSSIFIRCRH